MPLPPATVGFAISLASGLVKLGVRADRIFAEQEAVRSDLALPERLLILPPPAAQMKQKLQQLVAETAAVMPDPLGSDRQRLQELLAQDNPAEDQLFAQLQKYLPGDIEVTVDDPGGELARRLRERGNPDAETLRAALYYVAAGTDLRENTLAWQLGLAVLDVLAEFALENQALFIRNKHAQPIVAAVLTRFAEPELEQIGSWGGLLKHVLSATLNGALDARQTLDGHKEWLEGLLNALAQARAANEHGDDYILGLLQGRGYRTLVSALLAEGADYLAADAAGGFEQVIVALLRDAAPRVQATPSFQVFFQENWSDLVRAGLQSVHAYGPVILTGTDPLLGRALLAVVETLAAPGDHTFLSRTVFMDMVGNVIGAITVQPDLLNDLAWLQGIFASVASIVQEQEGRGLLSAASLDSILRGALATVAAHPDLLVDRPGLLQEVVGSVLTRLAGVSGLRLEQLASAAVTGMLSAVTDNAGLLDTGYATVVSALAEKFSRLVAEKSLSTRQASDLLTVVTQMIATNAPLFAVSHDGLATEVLDAILTATRNDPHTLIHGAALVLLTRDVFQVMAMRGLGLLEAGDAAQLGSQIQAVLQVGFELASRQLGRRLDLTHVPMVTGALVRAWSVGKAPVLEVDNAALNDLFVALTEAVIAASV